MFCVQVRGYPCDCQYPGYCDSQLGKLPPPRVQQLLQQQQEQQQENDQQTQHAPHPQPQQQQQSQAQQDLQTQQPQQQLLQQLNGCTLHDTGMNPGQQQQQHEGPTGLSNGRADPEAQSEPGNDAAAVKGGAASDVSTSAQALEDAHVHQVN